MDINEKKFTDEFKIEAVKQVTERGYAVHYISSVQSINLSLRNNQFPEGSRLG